MPAWTRFDVPLVDAEAGGSLRILLRVDDPSSITVALATQTGTYYSESLPAGSQANWTVPDEAKPNSLLTIQVGRLFQGRPQDSVIYETRLHVG